MDDMKIVYLPGKIQTFMFGHIQRVFLKIELQWQSPCLLFD